MPRGIVYSKKKETKYKYLTIKRHEKKNNTGQDTLKAVVQRIILNYWRKASNVDNNSKKGRLYHG